ncbi:MAG TPA: hypothetical protein DCG69_04915 [Bacteroidales bacterium]|nr:hypothetical protein [Bacteroidales bacterium]
MMKGRIILLALFVGLVTFTKAQDMNAAGAKFNEGIELDKAKDYAGAIKVWEESVAICNTLGAEAAELKLTVQKKLAYTYFKEGITLYKKESFDPAIGALKSAEKLAGEVADTKTQQQAATYIPKIYASKGLDYSTKKDYEGALKVFEEALVFNPKCVDAFYGKGMAYKELNQFENAIEAFDNVILFGAGNASATKKVASATEAAQLMFESKAATEMQIEHNAEAVVLLTNALKYNDQSVNAFYLLTLANNKLKKWDASIAAGQKALTLEGVDSMAIQFELGKAFQAKGENANACATFKLVTAGPNVAAAKYQITEVLKCN